MPKKRCSVDLKNAQVILFSCAFLFLSGCTSISIPTKLGISESEWEGLCKNKQQVLLSNYKKITEERSGFLKESKNKKEDNIYLEVAIHSGKIAIPPFNNNHEDWQDYKPVKFNISEGECRDITLQHFSNNKINTELSACFYNNTLYLDPSHYDLEKKNGSININFSPLWLTGFSYKNISSSGYAKLNNVTVEIKQHSAF